MVNKIASRLKFCSRGALAQFVGGGGGKSSATWGEVVCIQHPENKSGRCAPFKSEEIPGQAGDDVCVGMTMLLPDAEFF